MTLNRFSKLFLWAALWIFGFMCFLTFRGQSVPIRPRLHMGLTDPGHNGALLLEMWCDQLTVDHNNSGTYCWHNGVAVIVVPHPTNFLWIPLEAK